MSNHPGLYFLKKEAPPKMRNCFIIGQINNFLPRGSALGIETN